MKRKLVALIALTLTVLTVSAAPAMADNLHLAVIHSEQNVTDLLTDEVDVCSNTSPHWSYDGVYEYMHMCVHMGNDNFADREPPAISWDTPQARVHFYCVVNSTLAKTPCDGADIGVVLRYNEPGTNLTMSSFEMHCSDRTDCSNLACSNNNQWDNCSTGLISSTWHAGYLNGAGSDACKTSVFNDTSNSTSNDPVYVAATYAFYDETAVSNTNLPGTGVINMDDCLGV